MPITKTITINEKEYTLELSVPTGSYQDIDGCPLDLTYDVMINHFWMGRIYRKNGFWYPLDDFKQGPKSKAPRVIFEAADFQGMGEMIEEENAV